MVIRRVRWSWSKDEIEAGEFRAEARELVGEELAAVHYITLDYRREEFRGDVVGPRPITSPTEWTDPCWRHPACHTVDHAVELRTASERVFTASWESPGRIEGLGLRELPAIGSAVDEDRDVAIWDVSATPGWRSLIGGRVSSVDLHYERWDGSGALWCRRIDLRIDGRPVVLLLAEGKPWTEDLAPSADNVAVLFDGDVRPSWSDRS